MALRDSITYKVSPQLWALILKKMAAKRTGGMRAAARGGPATPSLCFCDGAPTSENMSYAAVMKGDICWDYTNNDVYLCTAWASTSSFTWTLIVD